jgi:hypothetical protein
VRAKKRQQDEENDKFNQLLARVNEQQQQINELRGVVHLQDPALDITASPSKRKSSVAESEAPTDDARWMIEGGPGYPVDGIKESISCELHQRMKNISMKVGSDKLYLVHLTHAGMAMRFQLAMLKSGWMKS